MNPRIIEEPRDAITNIGWLCVVGCIQSGCKQVAGSDDGTAARKDAGPPMNCHGQQNDRTEKKKERESGSCPRGIWKLGQFSPGLTVANR